MPGILPSSFKFVIDSFMILVMRFKTIGLMQMKQSYVSLNRGNNPSCMLEVDEHLLHIIPLTLHTIEEPGSTMCRVFLLCVCLLSIQRKTDRNVERNEEKQQHGYGSARFGY